MPLDSARSTWLRESVEAQPCDDTPRPCPGRRRRLRTRIGRTLGAQRLGTSIRLVHMLANYVPITPMLPLATSDLEAAGREILLEATTEAHSSWSLREYPRRCITGHAFRLCWRWLMVVLGSHTHSTVCSQVRPVRCRHPRHRPVVAVLPSWTHTGGTPQHRRWREVDPAFPGAGAASTGERGGAQGRIGLGARLGTAQRVRRSDHRPRRRRRMGRARTPHHRKQPGGIRDEFPEVPVDIRVVHGQPARVLQSASGEADLLRVARDTAHSRLATSAGLDASFCARVTAQSRSSRPPMNPATPPASSWSRPAPCRSNCSRPI